jgi:hypothetical protein
LGDIGRHDVKHLFVRKIAYYVQVNASVSPDRTRTERQTTQTTLLLRIFFKDLPATPRQYLDDISLVESLLEHMPDCVEPQAIPPKPRQGGNAL